ncbi:hypothetical protein NQ314_014559 [Rhamnusium bicolor]|uniref:Chitin-binding type-1 domain-containing protein n=1 Tax=Rhamnusium bicolor TaxID=1586634 RepID=A0AAV8X1F0_9CUCU|nr:hypothetical protein NQ314_014559 [Rhamnusium bicolor]
MCCQIVFLFLLSSSVFSEDLTIFNVDNFDTNREQLITQTPKFLDIYTNHKDFKTVLKNYYDVSRRPNSRKFERLPSVLQDTNVFKSFPYIEKVSPGQLEDTVHLDRIDFHYPSIEFFSDKNDELESNFGTIVDKNADNNGRFVFMQSQKVTTDNSVEDSHYHMNRRPNFKTQKHERLNFNYNNPVALSYEELAMNNSSSKKSGTIKHRINELLKRYLEKLYSQKYNGTSSNKIYPSPDSKYNSDNSMTDDLKTKFLDSNPLWNLKNKTINKFNKFFGLFTIVQFNNTHCNATNSAGNYLGICYTATECTSNGGTAVGNCASGYGVCCVFRGTCGDSGSQNCTYFESPNYPDYYPSDGGVVVPTTAGPTANPSPTPDPRLTWYFDRNKWGRQSSDTISCIFNVYKSNSNISKMRIDFLDLEALFSYLFCLLQHPESVSNSGYASSMIPAWSRPAIACNITPELPALYLLLTMTKCRCLTEAFLDIS